MHKGLKDYMESLGHIKLCYEKKPNTWFGSAQT